MGILPPGQTAILRSFAKHGVYSIYAPSDPLDMRVCCAMAAKGFLVQYREGGELIGYELTTAGAERVLVIQGNRP